MDMITRSISFDNLDLLDFRPSLDCSHHDIPLLPVQIFPAVFRYPDYVVLAIPDRVCQSFESFHFESPSMVVGTFMLGDSFALITGIAVIDTTGVASGLFL